jgi:CBS domain containing-hemolysin-like protein
MNAHTRRSLDSCSTSSVTSRRKARSSPRSGWQFEIIDMDGPRIDKLLVHPVQAN